MIIKATIANAVAADPNKYLKGTRPTNINTILAKPNMAAVDKFSRNINPQNYRHIKNNRLKSLRGRNAFLLMLR
jgi:hypothetical protein